MARVQQKENLGWRLVTRPVTRRFTRHGARYMEIFRIVRKYQLHYVLAELDMGQHRGGANAVALRDKSDQERRADNFAGALEELGACFIKLGQLLSTRPDLLPSSYIKSLARLQNRIKRVPSEEVVRIVESELGAPISELFTYFDTEPTATASMAQVHRATLSDGTIVAVKVQRPGVRRQTEQDLEILHEALRFARKYTSSSVFSNLQQMVREMEEGLIGDMDFMEEAGNTLRISQQLADYPLLSTPDVYVDLCTSSVLTMSFVEGKNLSKLSKEELEQLDGKGIARDLLAAYLKQIVVDGIFHCDPHPGNILMAPDGRLVLLDFGMVGRFDHEEQDKIIRLLLAFSERQGDRVADIYLNMVEVPRIFDVGAFKQDVSSFVSRYHDISGGRTGLGTMFLDLVRLAERHNSPVPSALTLLSKAMLNLDGVVSVLSPQLDPVGLIRDVMGSIMRQRIEAQARSGKQIGWSMDMWRLLDNAPRRADLLLNKLANDQMTVHLRLDHMEETAESLSRAARGLSRSILFGSIVIAAGYVLGSIRRSEGPRSSPGRTKASR